MFCFVFDDDATFCAEFEARLLRTFKAEVEYEIEYEAAVSRLAALSSEGKCPDIVFVDYRIAPPKTGIDFMKRLRLEQVAAPLVLLTEHDAPSIAKEAEAIGSKVILKSSVYEDRLLQEVILFALGQWSRIQRAQQEELARQRMRVLALAGGIAHEIANDVNKIRSYLRTASKLCAANGLSREKFAEIEGLINDTVSASNEMTGLLREYGAQRIGPAQLAPLRVEELVREALAQPSYASIGARIARFETSVMCDRQRLKRALVIVCDNAMKYAGPTPAMHFDFERSETPVKAFFIDIEDDGPGIEARYWEAIFVPGDRGPLKKLGRAGWGLGLSFARTLIESHELDGERGTIQCVEPRYGKGARFRIALPGGRS